MRTNRRRYRLHEWMDSPAITSSRDGITPLNPAEYNDTVIDANSTVANWAYLLGALRSKAPGQWSQNILELSRHFTSSIYLALNTMSNQSQSADMTLYEKTEDPAEGDIELHDTHMLAQFLEDPNDDDSFGDILYQLTQQLGLTGIGLIWKPITGDVDLPSEMYVIPSATALPWPPSPVYPHGSYLIQPYYPYGPFSTIPSYQSAAGARIPAEQIIRIKNAHPLLRYDGYAALTAIRSQVDVVDSIDTARLSTQRKGIDPTVCFEFDPSLYNPQKTDLQRLRVQLEALYSGPLNAGKIMFNPFGSKITPLSNKPSEMGWVEGWNQLVDFTLAAYGTPKSVAGLQEASSFATLYAALRQFYLLSLNPLLKKISTKFNKQLIRPYYGRGLYMTLEGQKITDEEMLERQLSTDMQHGIRTRNEIRKLRGLKPIEGKKGDELVGYQPIQESQESNPMGGQDQSQEESGDDFDLPMEDQEQDRDVERNRPENEQGKDSLGPRINRVAKMWRGDRLAMILERHKTNGTVGHLNGD